MNMLEAIRCKRTSRKLSSYLDLENGAHLSNTEILAIKTHLSQCEKCTEKLSQLSKMRGALGALGKSMKSDKEQLEGIKLKINELLEGME